MIFGNYKMVPKAVLKLHTAVLIFVKYANSIYPLTKTNTTKYQYIPPLIFTTNVFTAGILG